METQKDPVPTSYVAPEETEEKSVKGPQKKSYFWKYFKYIAGMGIIYSFFILAIVSGYVRLNYNHTLVEQKDCAVIFGAAVWKDNIPSHALFDRTISGVNLYKDEKVNCLIFSGGKSKYGTHESDVMKKVALRNNVPEKDIFLDYAGINTLATLQNLQKNFTEKTFVMVSNDFHLARIKLIAKKLKIKDFGLHSAKYNKGKYFKNNNFFWREVAGVLYYSLFLW